MGNPFQALEVCVGLLGGLECSGGSGASLARRHRRGGAGRWAVLGRGMRVSIEERREGRRGRRACACGWRWAGRLWQWGDLPVLTSKVDD